jgi:hypothetical protein
MYAMAGLFNTPQSLSTEQDRSREQPNAALPSMQNISALFEKFVAEQVNLFKQGEPGAVSPTYENFLKEQKKHELANSVAQAVAVERPERTSVESPSLNSREHKVNGVPVYDQNSAIDGATARRGCAITSFAMVTSHFTGRTMTVDEAASSGGGIALEHGRALASRNGIRTTDLGDLGRTPGMATEAEAFNTFAKAFDKGHLMVFAAGGEFTQSNGHVMVATGVSEVNGVRMITFNDPAGGRERTMEFSRVFNAADHHSAGRVVYECEKAQ